MQKELVFATNNGHKIEEVLAKVGDSFKILSLNDIGFDEDIEENGLTFEANASIKSRLIYQRFALDCFGDDSGLEVEALNNEPGVYSARYAGTHGNHEANMDKLLAELGDNSNRKARFRTVISLLWKGQEHFFDGSVEGTIRTERSGSKGFGYDPIFQPDGYDITFAEMSMEQKNSISHRGRAVEKMAAFKREIMPQSLVKSTEYCTQRRDDAKRIILGETDYQLSLRVYTILIRLLHFCLSWRGL